MKIDVSGVDPGRLDGNAYAEPGTYHWIVNEINEEDDKGHFCAYLTILAGTPKGMEGRTHREVFYLTQAAIGRLLQFAVALKLVTTEAVARAQADGDEIDVDWTKAAGRQFCGRLSKKKNQDGTTSDYCELGFAIWALDSKAAKGVALDVAKAKEFLGTPAAGKGATTKATKPAAAGKSAVAKPAAQPQPAAAAATAAAAASDPFGGAAADDLFGG